MDPSAIVVLSRSTGELATISHGFASFAWPMFVAAECVSKFLSSLRIVLVSDFLLPGVWFFFAGHQLAAAKQNRAKWAHIQTSPPVPRPPSSPPPPNHPY